VNSDLSTATAVIVAIVVGVPVVLAGLFGLHQWEIRRDRRAARAPRRSRRG
jgi:hypothetical protein